MDCREPKSVQYGIAMSLCTLALIACATEEALATQTWCAVVNANVDGGILNVREGPSPVAPIIYQLSPKEIVGISTGQCASGLDSDTICAKEGSSWVPLEIRYITPIEYVSIHGWINERYVTQIPCYDEFLEQY